MVVCIPNQHNTTRVQSPSQLPILSLNTFISITYIFYLQKGDTNFNLTI